jgi:glycosyltransferase involved in cell wall biosynthesis
MPPIKVAFVLPNLDVGGAQRAHLLIGRYLDHAQVDAVFVSLHPSTSERASLHASFSAAGLAVHDLQLHHRADRSLRALLLGAWRLHRLCRRERIDIVDSSVVEADLVARVATIRTSARHVTHLVNTTYDPAVVRRLPHRSRIRLDVLRRIDALSARRSSAFVALTKGVAASARRDLGLDRTKLVVIPRGVDLDEFAFEPRATAHPVLKILSLGRLAPQKGHETALGAMALLEQWGIKADLLIAGAGSLLGELQRLTASLGLTERVTFAGAVETNAVVDLLADADVFCFPSKWEGQGNAVLEAMAAGCPVVASDIGPLREVVGDAGILVPPEDPMALADGLRRVALMSTGERAALCLNARERVEERFDARRRVRDLATFYRNLLPGDLKGGCRLTGPTSLPIDSLEFDAANRAGARK